MCTFCKIEKAIHFLQGGKIALCQKCYDALMKMLAGGKGEDKV